MADTRNFFKTRRGWAADFLHARAVRADQAKFDAQAGRGNPPAEGDGLPAEEG